jgi:hypothetical protein
LGDGQDKPDQKGSAHGEEQGQGPGAQYLAFGFAAGLAKTQPLGAQPDQRHEKAVKGHIARCYLPMGCPYPEPAKNAYSHREEKGQKLTQGPGYLPTGSGEGPGGQAACGEEEDGNCIGAAADEVQTFVPPVQPGGCAGPHHFYQDVGLKIENRSRANQSQCQQTRERIAGA